MAVSWTIAGATTSGTFAALGISAVRRTLLSADTDRVTFVADGSAMDAAALFAYGETVTISRDGVAWFKGRVNNLPRQGSGAAESVAYELVGPWWYLEQAVFQQQWMTYQPDLFLIGPPEGFLGRRYKSRVVLCQDDDGDKITSGEQITAAVAYARDVLDAPVEIGTVDPALDLPYDEATDISCAEVIRRMLRWSPDCVAYWDYTQPVPVLHVRRVSNLLAVSRAITSVSALTVTPRYDMQIPGVVLRYEKLYTSTEDGFEYESFALDEAGTTDDVRTFFSTIELAGANLSRLNQAVVVEELPAALFEGGDEDDRKTWWRQKLEWLADAAVDIESISVADLAAADGATLVDDLGNILVEGQVQDWMTGIHAQEQVLTATVKYAVSDGAENVHEEQEKVVTFRFVATDATTRTYSRVADSDSGEPVPVGLAAAIYAAWGRLQYDGNLTIVEEDCTTPLRPGHRLNLAGGLAGWAAMDAVVVQVDESLDDGTTQVSFGPARHLSPGDIIALFRSTRSRRVSTGWGKRASGLPQDDANAATTGGLAPVQKATSGAGECRLLVVKDGDGNSIRIDLADVAGGRTIKPRVIQVCEDGVAKSMYVLCSETFTPS